MELVGLSKIPVIVGMQACLREYGTEHSGGRRRCGKSCGCYLKSYGSGRQDLHESGRHSEDEEKGGNACGKQVEASA